MLKDNSQLKLSLSPYQGLYDAIIPSNHLLRKLKENIDFSFVNPMLRKQYCENFGRPAKEPEMMFKLLFLKKLYDLSDETLISSAQTDMAYKFFLDLEPEAKMIDPSLLTKFRKTRVTEDILEEMLKETIQQALEKGLIKPRTIIVDSTHTNASVRAKSPAQILRDMSKQLRKEVYKNAFELSEKFPEKPSPEAGLEEEISYTEEPLKALEEGFCYNKDAGKLQCPAGELAMRVEKRTAKNGNTYLRYVFSKVKCRKCPLRESCRVGSGKSKECSYSITQASERNLARLKFEESEHFRERMKIRRRIEEKNGELKEAHGLRRADSRGLFAMELQMYFTAFVANVKRISKLAEPVTQ